jgi:DNA invertase Pin-like site-specific DNA recombinase
MAIMYGGENLGVEAMANGKFVSYLRVSTARQGRSGLGLEAQREAVRTYLDGGKWKLVAEYVEVESGKKDDRPELAKALHRAKVTGATLIVAKLDRLSRNVAFLSNLQDSKVKFVACDLPEANEFTINIMAAVAQHERKIIGERTRVAMAAAKNNPAWKRAHPNGFGNPNGAKALRGAGNDAAVEKLKAEANRHAEAIVPIIEDIRASGALNLRAIAAELNEREILTARGGQWHASSVRNVMQRMKAEMAN